FTVCMLVLVWTNARVFFSRLRAEAENDRQRQLIDLLLRDFEEHASDWLWEVSPDGSLRHVSARLAQNFGLSSRQLLQRSFTGLIESMLPSDMPEAQDAFEQLCSNLRLGRPFRDLELPVRNVTQTGLTWWSLMAKPL